VRFGNTALSAPHVTEVVDLFDAVVVLVAGAAVDLVELVVAGVLGVPGAGAELESGLEIDESTATEVDVVEESAIEEEPQADKSPSPTRARQEKRGFCIPLLHTIYHPPWGIPASLARGSGSGVSTLNGRVLVGCSSVKTPPEQSQPHTYGGKILWQSSLHLMKKHGAVLKPA
jgi:hypothetical protein